MLQSRLQHGARQAMGQGLHLTIGQLALVGYQQGAVGPQGGGAVEVVAVAHQTRPSGRNAARLSITWSGRRTASCVAHCSREVVPVVTPTPMAPPPTAISISTRGSSPITTTCSGCTPSWRATKRRAAWEGLPVSSGSTPVTRTMAPAMAQL